VTVALGLLLALSSTAALSWGFVAQHGAAAGLPPLALRRPLHSLRLLVAHREWLAGFLSGIGGWVLYVAALALAPLSLVQATSAGGIGLLALLAQRRAGQRLPRAQWAGVTVAVAGLGLLGVSLVGGAAAGARPSWVDAALWTALSALAAAVAAGPVAPSLAGGAGLGVAAGLLYAAGDVGTKAAILGGAWLLFVPALLACHGSAFVALQLGFQRGGALATAGVATLLTNALPIAGGIVLFHETLPEGPLGVARAVAFACVVAGAATLARPSARADGIVAPA
jgi:drug/metabolite transporter (DMT)-like permease